MEGVCPTTSSSTSTFLVAFLKIERFFFFPEATEPLESVDTLSLSIREGWDEVGVGEVRRGVGRDVLVWPLCLKCSPVLSVNSGWSVTVEEEEEDEEEEEEEEEEGIVEEEEEEEEDDEEDEEE